MSLFCLVHGAFQGAWCWDLLIPYLEAQGHKTVAMDLPIENASATLSQFADVVIQALPKTDDDIVLVGHSMAGTIIPLVAEAVKVRQLVFVGGLIPYPGISTLDQFSHHLDADTLKSLNYQPKDPSKLQQFHNEPGMFEPASVGKDFSDAAVLMDLFYHDCQPNVAQWAISKSRSQQSMAYIFETNPLKALPKVERKYIVCTNDRIISPTWSRYATRKRLGVDAIELASGHCPHLSYPDLLAKALTSS
ncbi:MULTISPECIES: alpha/beta fold hydrolase [Fischerella]|uniref:Alpha/beta hydrolase n=1 Tax=Fischerella muscicola CCMEE 5323 TaxID=2019572 RepID=A0A2N6K8V4_FISMU|nr:MULTISPECIES: alpha/beta hydrolase [Fischerella]MBD2433114.1 alpha/beta hydrolase [Fischerella sp. FACHB-380]PLZ93921.1 alpha/beta hydrolase [Fischerella muscicola CCMEE 5323]